MSDTNFVSINLLVVATIESCERDKGLLIFTTNNTGKAGSTLTESILDGFEERVQLSGQLRQRGQVAVQIYIIIIMIKINTQLQDNKKKFAKTP